MEAAGADVVPGDSLAMVSLGHSTTPPVTLEQMLLHTQVCRGFSQPLAEQPLAITDLPFLSYQWSRSRSRSRRKPSSSPMRPV